MANWGESIEQSRIASPDGRFAIVTTLTRDDRCCIEEQSLLSADGTFRFEPTAGLFAFQSNGTVDYSVRIRSSGGVAELRHFVIDPNRPGYHPAELSGIWKPLPELEELVRVSETVPQAAAHDPPEGLWSTVGTLAFFAFCFAIVLYDPPSGRIARLVLPAVSGLLVAASLWGVWDAWQRRSKR